MTPKVWLPKSHLCVPPDNPDHLYVNIFSKSVSHFSDLSVLVDTFSLVASGESLFTASLTKVLMVHRFC